MSDPTNNNRAVEQSYYTPRWTYNWHHHNLMIQKMWDKSCRDTWLNRTKSQLYIHRSKWWRNIRDISRSLIFLREHTGAWQQNDTLAQKNPQRAFNYATQGDSEVKVSLLFVTDLWFSVVTESLNGKLNGPKYCGDAIEFGAINRGRLENISCVIIIYRFPPYAEKAARYVDVCIRNCSL